MKKFILSAVLFLGLSVGANAQMKDAKTFTANVKGNCKMCEKRIAKAGTQNDVSVVSWNPKTQMAVIIYNPAKTTPDKVLQQIATAGHDNERYRAKDSVYAKLPECCQYERMSETEMDSE